MGPYTGDKTSRISKIMKGGTVIPIAAGFPSTKDALGDIMGVADIAFLNGQLYALIAGGGCSHGNPDVPSGVAQVDLASGKWSMLANLGDFIKVHQARYENAGDFEPDGALYSLIAAEGSLYAVEANHGQVFEVSQSGAISELIDVSASQGHVVPSAIGERNGVFYVGNLNTFPIDPQSSQIFAIARARQHVDLAPGFGGDDYGYRIANSTAGFTAVLGVAFGPDGLLYALEFSTAPGNPSPGTGKVVRVKTSGEIEEVVTGLAVPTGMTFGPDGGLYISNLGAAPPGAGQILRFDIAPGF